MKGVAIREILEDREYGLGLTLLAGASGLSRQTYIPKIQKLGLVIAGRMLYLHPRRIQILGHMEISYLRSLDDMEEKRIIRELCNNDVVCFIVTSNLEVPEFFLFEADRKGIPLLRTDLVTSILIERLTRLLLDRLAPSTYIHGVFLDVLGVGVLITGRPGIGKSENALELVMKGHRLVADDVVNVKRIGFRELYGEAPEMLTNLLEIRGIGVVDMKRLFGVSSVVEKKRVDLVVELVPWDEEFRLERLGMEEEVTRILGVDVPLVRVPISPGKNASTIIELACRNFLLKREGRDRAKEVEERSLKVIQGRSE
jgi:HPr kinase/phosphorylase